MIDIPKDVSLPLMTDIITDLYVGDSVLLHGTMYTLRDAACQGLFSVLDKGESLPFEIRGQAIYFMGPSPAKPGQVIGAAGPTTSGRMSDYLPRLLDEGLKGVVGKGGLSQEARAAMKTCKAIYFAAVGGIGALLSQKIKKVSVVAYRDLGPEAILRLEVKGFPVIVVNDIHGGDLYNEGRAKYRVKD
ncbi:MAG: FumA C-terminus/TtdB family hydratase beta subunit [Chloroflexota bacterium]|nr:FumA C-terminus/TtdB family hydratase beta subunit [Chloroflexota bacterium]